MIVLTLEDDRICAITWFSDSSVFPSSDCRAHCSDDMRARPHPFPPQAPLSV